MIEAKGYMGGSVSFDGEFVTLSRKGINRLTIGKGTKRIHISNISAVQFKPAGPVVNGFIQFSLSGGREKLSRFGRQTADATHDENSVVFYKKQQPAFEALREAVETAIARSHRPVAAAAVQPGIADQLAKLAELRATGALSEAEFDAAKRSLLGG